MIKTLAALAFAGAAFAPLAFADDAHHKNGSAAPTTSAAQGATASSSPMADGEIRKVDKDAKKITIKHGPLEKLDMPAMTMVFRVKDPQLLGKVKVGDKVKFDAEKVGGAYTVTKIEPAR